MTGAFITSCPDHGGHCKLEGHCAVGSCYLANCAAVVQRQAADVVNLARHCGLVLTIEQRPLKPLAMGHHETVVCVRRAR